jgi:hypothetical protein
MLQLVLVLIAIGVALYLFNVYVTMIDARIKTLINVVVILCAVLYVLAAFGVIDALRAAPVPRVN